MRMIEPPRRHDAKKFLKKNLLAPWRFKKRDDPKAALIFENASELDALLNHQLQQVADAVAVAPFVVVPADDFEEVFV
jgi:hypothetical protein